jgi:Putative adhesin
MVRGATVIGTALLAIGVIGLGVELANGQGLYRLTDMTSYDQTKRFVAADVKIVIVDVDVAHVRLIRGSTRDIQVHVYGDVPGTSTEQDILFQGTVTGQQLHVTVKHPWLRHSFFTAPMSVFQLPRNLTVDVELPEGAYDELSADVIAGKLEMDGVDAQQITLSDDAGEIQISNVDGRLQVKSNAGTVNVNHVIGAMDLRTDAGNISVNVDAIRDDIQARTNAGAVSVRVKNVPPNLQFHLKTNVGRATVALPNTKISRDTRFAIDGSIGSGGPVLDLQSDVGAVSLDHG